MDRLRRLSVHTPRSGVFGKTLRSVGDSGCSSRCWRAQRSREVASQMTEVLVVLVIFCGIAILALRHRLAVDGRSSRAGRAAPEMVTAGQAGATRSPTHMPTAGRRTWRLALVLHRARRRQRVAACRSDPVSAPQRQEARRPTLPRQGPIVNQCRGSRRVNLVAARPAQLLSRRDPESHCEPIPAIDGNHRERKVHEHPG